VHIKVIKKPVNTDINFAKQGFIIDRKEANVVSLQLFVLVSISDFF
jgi:hypothetical protein